MTLANFKALLLILAINISTAYIAQDSSLTCLQTKKVDFLLECHLRYKSLKTDTMLMGRESRTKDTVIMAQGRQITNLADVSKLKDTIITKHKVALVDLSKKYDKSQKTAKFFKTTTVTGISIIVVLLGLLLVK